MNKKVLVIDDDKVDQLSMRRALSNKGKFEVICASSAEEGVTLAREQKPDIVIIDTLLPGMNGPDACRKIKSEGSVIKVILTTGSVDAVDAYNARKAGADDYVVKAFDLTPLVDAVQRLCHGD